MFKVFCNRRKDWADLEAMLRSRKLDGDVVVARVDELLGRDDGRAIELRSLVIEIQP